MGTGSEAIGVSSFRKRLHVLSDRPDELLSGNVKSYLAVSRCGLSFEQFDSKHRKALSFQHFDFPTCRDDARWAALVGEVLNEIEGIGQVALVIIDDVPISIIPSDLFPASTDALSNLLHLEHGTVIDAQIVQTPIEIWDAQCVAQAPNQLGSLINSARVIPAFCAWIPALMRNVKPYHIHIYISESTFRLALLQGKDLKIHNVFAYEAASDVLYFTMAALEQLSVLHTEVALTLYGNVASGSELHQLFAKYMTIVNFGQKPIELTYSYAFKDLEGHAFPFILNAPLCA